MFLIIFESNDTLKEYCTDNSTNKNIFLFKDKNHYLSNICGEEHVISNKNKSTWREKFICLENIDMKDHFPTEIHSFSYDPVPFVIQNELNDANITLRIVSDSVINLDRTLECENHEKKLQFLIKYIKILKLELIDLEYEPEDTEKIVNYNNAIQKVKSIYFNKHDDLAGILYKLTHTFDSDIEILLNAKTLIKLEVIGESTNLNYCLAQIISERKPLEYISLENVKLNNSLYHFLTNISPRIFSLKNYLNPPVELKLAYYLFGFFSFNISNFCSQLSTLVINGNKEFGLYIILVIKIMKYLKTLWLLYIFEENIQEKIIKEFESITNLEELNLSQNFFDCKVNIKV
ncbi:hypothetical protein CWI36_0096p0020 [Hamiltosporidium magnivora]|uniref:Uncharacterized protein n=1 Tax=Hamiltosporidium magnivora TaxID=148818 RepID=A0A4Q9LLJ0_9MICR|nr:hypothetical protein CWI36_0096p0020 [Hamiltosporidium magnivora]